jgi:hypothetical protein
MWVSLQAVPDRWDVFEATHLGWDGGWRPDVDGFFITGTSYWGSQEARTGTWRAMLPSKVWVAIYGVKYILIYIYTHYTLYISLYIYTHYTYHYIYNTHTYYIILQCYSILMIWTSTKVSCEDIPLSSTFTSPICRLESWLIGWWIGARQDVELFKRWQPHK